MFEINDIFLKNLGYDTDDMSAVEKDDLKQQFTAEFSERIQERLADELSPEQAEEFLDIQNNQKRTRQWLDEFHAGYRTAVEFQQIKEAYGSEDEAATFYATALWLNDAVPEYGKLIQSELNDYQTELAQMRKEAYLAVDSL